MSRGEEHLFRILDEKIDLLLQARQSNEALRIAEKAVVMARRIFPLADARRASALRKFGVILKDSGRREEALQCFDEALEACQAAAENGVVNESLQARLHAHAGFLADELGDETAARHHYEEAAIFDTGTAALERATSAIIHNNLAVIYKHEERNDLAEDHYLLALNAYEQSLGTDHSDVAVLLGNIGNFYMNADALDLAERMHTRALAIREKLLPREHPDLAWSKSHLALVYHLQGDTAHAEPLYRDAFEIWELAGVPPDSSSYAHAAENYLQLLQVAGRTHDAARFEKHLRKRQG